MCALESGLAIEGTVIRTQHQSQGRGRHGRCWEEGEGNLYFSFLISPHINADKLGHISLLTGLSLQKTILSIVKGSAYSPLIKWPNDVLLDQKKCAGILIETPSVSTSGIIDHLVIGIGVNISSAPIETSSYLNAYNKNIRADDVLEQFLQTFSLYYDAWRVDGFEGIRVEWINNSFKKGQPINVKLGKTFISGAFETIDQFGNLVILCNETNEKRTITSGDVFLL